MAVANLEQVEEQRLSLEENTAKLRKALQHWRQWDAEYEGLKEELLALDSGASHDDMVGLLFSFVRSGLSLAI